jgi:hypothetical protein
MGAPELNRSIFPKITKKNENQIFRWICIGKPIGTQGEIRVLHFSLFFNYFVAYLFPTCPNHGSSGAQQVNI